MKNIGGLIKGERERLGISQIAVSKMVGIDRATLSLYENGERDISLSNLKKIASFFGKSISSFLNEEREDDLKMSYRAEKLSEEDEKKIDRAKQTVINIYKLKKMLN